MTSARAMDESTMKRLWDCAWSTERKEFGPVSRKRKAENPSEWAGFYIRMMLYLLYLVSMLCLLRFDEALRITWSDVVFQVKDTTVEGHWHNVTPETFTKAVKRQPEDFRIQLNLPFRKTHQYGGEQWHHPHSRDQLIGSSSLGIAPFYIYANRQRPWMCLLQAFAMWWVLARERNQHLDGFVFRKKVGADRTSVNPTDGMVSHAHLPHFHRKPDKGNSHQRAFLNASETICWTSKWTLALMEHILSVVEGASTSTRS